MDFVVIPDKEALTACSIGFPELMSVKLGLFEMPSLHVHPVLSLWFNLPAAVSASRTTCSKDNTSLSMTRNDTGTAERRRL
jgi:hypothetical protein